MSMPPLLNYLINIFMKFNILAFLFQLIAHNRSSLLVKSIASQAAIRARQISEDLPCYSEVPQLIRKILRQQEFQMIPLLYQEILHYNIYVLSLKPLLQLICVVREAFVQKYIRSIPSFPPFTEDQVQDEALSVFNDFIDSLCVRGSRNLFTYIKSQLAGQALTIYGDSLLQHPQPQHYEKLLTFTQKANSSNIQQPNDFRRQSSIVLKHLSKQVQQVHEIRESREETPSHKGQNDLLFIFVGDIHHHKIFEDPEHLLNHIEHMTPYFWGTKYVPLMHKISECLDEDELESPRLQDQDSKISRLEMEQKKQLFAELLRMICKDFVQTLKGINFQTLYHYSLSLSFLQFMNRLQQNQTMLKAYSLSTVHFVERNYRRHYFDFKRRKSNYLREIHNHLLIKRAEKEYILSLLNM